MTATSNGSSASNQPSTPWPPPLGGSLPSTWKAVFACRFSVHERSPAGKHLPSQPRLNDEKNA